MALKKTQFRFLSKMFFDLKFTELLVESCSQKFKMLREVRDVRPKEIVIDMCDCILLNGTHLQNALHNLFVKFTLPI